MKLQLVLTKEQLESLTELLDLALKLRGLDKLTQVVDLYNVLLAAKELKDEKAPE